MFGIKDILVLFVVQKDDKGCRFIAGIEGVDGRDNL